MTALQHLQRHVDVVLDLCHQIEVHALSTLPLRPGPEDPCLPEWVDEALTAAAEDLADIASFLAP